MKKSFIVLLLVLSFSCREEKATETEKNQLHIEDLFYTEMKAGASCFRIPATVTAPNGDVIAAIDERVPSCGDLRSNKDINIVMRRSSDNGITWSSVEKIIDFPLGESASDPSMIVDKVTGDLFLFYNYMNLQTEKDIYYLHVVKSSDSGKTWSEPEDITHQITKPGWKNDFKFITSGRGIQTRTGNLLHCLVNLNNGMHVFGSKDHGASWYLIDTPILPADESKIVELADGTLMINARVNKSGLRFVHTSSDQGVTWTSTADSTLIDPGCNASIIRYTSLEEGFKKNRLLFSNAKSVNGRTNLTVRISYDEGKTWSDGKTIYKGSAAYSSLTVLDNGDIGLFFEREEYTKNSFARFSLDWLTDGKDQLLQP